MSMRRILLEENETMSPRNGGKRDRALVTQIGISSPTLQESYILTTAEVYRIYESTMTYYCCMCLSLCWPFANTNSEIFIFSSFHTAKYLKYRNIQRIHTFLFHKTFNLP